MDIWEQVMAAGGENKDNIDLFEISDNYSNFAHRFCLCTLKIQYLAVIQLSKGCCYAA